MKAGGSRESPLGQAGERTRDPGPAPPRTRRGAPLTRAPAPSPPRAPTRGPRAPPRAPLPPRPPGPRAPRPPPRALPRCPPAGEFAIPVDRVHPRDVCVRLVGHDGVPQSADAVAYDPVSGSLVLSSRGGQLKTIGRDGVQALLPGSRDGPTRALAVVPGHPAGLVARRAGERPPAPRPPPPAPRPPPRPPRPPGADRRPRARPPQASWSSGAGRRGARGAWTRCS